MAISVPENRIGELQARARSSSSCCGRTRQKLYPARVREIAPAVDPATRTFAVRVSIVDADPSVQWGMTANVGVLRAGQRRRGAAAADVDLSARTASPRCGVFDPATRQGQRCVPVADRPVSRGRRGRDVGRAPTATGSWPPACTSCSRARSCGPTRAARRRPAAGRRPRDRTGSRRRRADAADARDMSDEPRSAPAAPPARASTCPSGRSTHRPLVLFLILVFALAGVLAYERLGQSEDPPFTFKVMVVKTNWPGATAREVEQQVTDRIERKLQEVPNVDWVRSYSQARRVAGVLRDQGLRAGRASVPETFVPGAQEDRRHPQHAAGRASRVRSSTTSSATPTPTSTR